MAIVAESSKTVRANDDGTAAEASAPMSQVPHYRGGMAWREALRTALRDPAQLLSLLELPSDLLPAAKRAAEAFPLFAPLGYVARMRKGEVQDPLLSQVLPLAEELAEVPGFAVDPVGDLAAAKSPGLLHKYHGRALLVTTGACAIHCRYCFRRHFPYSETPRAPAAWQPAIDSIAADPTIEEVLLSGGDPLTLVDSHLAELAERLARVPHLKRLRVHTRLPIVIPERVTDELLGWLRGTRLAPIMVVHANHPQEIDEFVAASLTRLVDAGIPVLNQSVLLRGVNDDAAALIELSKQLINLRVMPYYLHQLDRVAGAAHFDVPIERGRELIAQLHASLPGYAVPRYVQEIAGEDGKRVLA